LVYTQRDASTLTWRRLLRYAGGMRTPRLGG